MPALARPLPIVSARSANAGPKLRLARLNVPSAGSKLCVKPPLDDPSGKVESWTPISLVKLSTMPTAGLPREVYVQPYPGPGGRWLISTNGGTDPVWSRDGRELFYLHDDAVMAVTVTAATTTFTASTPQRLFEGRYESSVAGRNYDLSPDGKRFVMVRSEEVAPTARLHVVLNWLAELRARAK